MGTPASAPPPSVSKSTKDVSFSLMTFVTLWNRTNPCQGKICLPRIFRSTLLSGDRKGGRFDRVSDVGNELQLLRLLIHFG
jgi:hypothetical protein